MGVFPVILHKEFKASSAEKSILERFLLSKICQSEAEHVFHSIRAQITQNQIVGEIDFVYVDKDIILFLEVKGGIVEFDPVTRQWKSGINKRDPWRQVGNYLFHLRDVILPRFESEQKIGSRN